jgi:Rad3-related DNA helicase
MEVQGVQLALPEFVTELRSHQLEAIDQIVTQFADRDVVILDAPTGAGKTIIGEAVRQMMADKYRLSKALYLCTTKSLQEQFLHDFTYAKLIKGRSNYPTFDNPDLFKMGGSRHMNASMCTKKTFDAADLPLCAQCEVSDADAQLGWADHHDEQEGELRIRHCHYCHPWQSCPYEIAKNQALAASLAVANTAYLLTEANYVGRFGYSETYKKPNFPFFIVDEADTLESVLMGFVEVSLSPRSLKGYGLSIPDKVTVPSSWLEWAENARQRLTELAIQSGHEIESYNTDPPPLNVKRQNERIVRDLQTIQYAENALRTEPDNWVLDGYKEGGVTLKPVTISSHTRRLLWKHSTKFLLMSATVISPDQLAQDLGLTEHEFGYVTVDSNFPPERRPIYIHSKASMTNKTKDTEWPKMVEAVGHVLDRHPGERVLVHTVSYAWTQFLHDNLRLTHGSRLLSYANSQERESILETYKSRPDAVLLAPSLDRGIDLPYELCSVIVITKVPYPNLGDQQIKKRFYGTGQAGKNWYVTETIRSIVQMTGRGMRHRDDYCTTYILDSQFRSNVWANSIGRTRIPRWWTDALSWPSPTRSR